MRLDQIVEAVAERARARANGRVDFRVRTEPTVVRGDPARIHRAVSNLVDNAIKWSPPGGPVELQLAGGALTVRDHRPGFGDGDLPRVFERFYRADAARGLPGSGLGLASSASPPRRMAVPSRPPTRRTRGRCCGSASGRSSQAPLRLAFIIEGVRILVVEDDAKMAAAIRRGLRFEGLAVDVASGGERALRMVGATEYDAIVLDVMMPGLDGFETVRRLRSDGVWVPVLMLTARHSVDDRVRGLDGGADDYLTKPFSLAELMARLRALARRGPLARPTVIAVGDLRLDPASREVWRGDRRIDLSAREFALLETFMRRPGQVLTQPQLLESVWDLGYEQRSNVVEVYVRYVREKIDRPFGVTSLETVRGVGYRLRKDGGM